MKVSTVSVGRRARITALAVDATDVIAEHDGYRFLAGAPTHRRRWVLADSLLSIDDLVQPAMPSVARFKLAPGLKLVACGKGAWDVRDSYATLARVDVTIGDARVVESSHAARFGSSVEVDYLAVVLASGKASCVWSWNG